MPVRPRTRRIAFRYSHPAIISPPFSRQIPSLLPTLNQRQRCTDSPISPLVLSPLTPHQSPSYPLAANVGARFSVDLPCPNIYPYDFFLGQIPSQENRVGLGVWIVMEVSSRPPNPAMPYREDCWSEGETSVLVDAWGDRFLDLNRGNLRQKQWQEVADAVNARLGAGRRPPRTDVQCKNRIDTLKKKYKIEKGKISDGAYGSQWPFFSRLDMLIGSSVPVKKPPISSSSSPPLALPLLSYRKGLPLPAAAAVRAVQSLPKEKRPASVGLSMDDSYFGRNYTVAAAAAAAAAAAGVEFGSSSKLSGSSTERSRSTGERSARGLKKRRKGREGGGIGEVARVIEWFADIYEKLEVEKQRQMIELEKERMEFIKGLEFQRMQMFVDTQVQMEKIKRARRSDADICS